MTIKNADMPAIPFEEVQSRLRGLPDKWVNHKGLTKREMIAMHMMAACRNRGSNYMSWKDMAKDALEMSEALLAELEHTNGN